ncbi:group 1 truncated hemoglobin [Cyanobacterium stanieri LEGE 03274]|uniref:Group 1 truncated hemoglobin n=1 Tax=Cyanobacterium stanieri LEGE 03274 TaxID=1828756 RepID=A0ABR9V6S2_9CHRO|nr:group 1 truncated hemoglobin [Cyanobacterium stanieri]MBE9223578.1 group 1 truncated hemoglobin [Cyanobacterium stanieri LEGE 03274]
MKTLYEKLGGKEAVDIAVDMFYEKVLNDERVKHFFVNTDMKQQKNHQKAFMTYAFGGTEKFTGRNMRDAHKDLVDNMGLTDVHFDAIAQNLVETLQELNVSQENIDEVVKIVGAVEHRNDVLNR